MSAGRTTLLALFGAIMLWFAASALGHDRAAAQCSTCGAPPPPTCGSCGPPSPPPKPPTCNTCGGGGGGNHDVKVPGINVYVAPSVVVNANINAKVNNSVNIETENNAFSKSGAYAYGGATANAWANSNATATGGSTATGYGTGFGYGACCGGGGQSFYTPPMATGMIQGMVIEGQQVPRSRRVAYEATRTRMRKVVIQAYCLDDRDVPHPASQVTPDREIDDMYDGELYRCIAGARMQYVIADYNGRIAFDGGQTVVCGKNEALYHVPGGGQGGQYAGGANGGGASVACRTQKAARDCNERSLLRRFGAGVKILTMLSTERYTAYREEQVMEQAAQTVMTGMSLDGGVGGVAF